MATSCATEVTLESEGVVSTSSTDRNLIRVRGITIPAYVGRRAVDEFRSRYYGLGVIGIGDRETGDTMRVIPVSVLPMEILLDVGFAGNVWYSGLPNVQLGIKFCART